MSFKKDVDLLEHVGGLDRAVGYLVMMRQHEDCCGQFWKMYNDYGKGRAKHKVVGQHIDRVYSNDEGLEDEFFTPDELESAIQRRLKRYGLIASEGNKVVYTKLPLLPVKVDPSQENPYWSKSPRLLIEYVRDGEVCHALGRYCWTKDKSYPSEFHLEGHGGSWSQYVTGWAYL